MKQNKKSKPFMHEIMFPFRGNWNLIWVIQRYFKSSLSGITMQKLWNAIIAFVEMITGKAIVQSKPFVLRLEPTNICNLRCPRCSCGINTDPRKKGYIKLEDFRNILEENKRNTIILRLDGDGEPTLHPQIIEIIAIAKSFGLAVSMSTNLNTQISKDANGIIRSGLDRLIVPIDGITQISHEKYRVGGDLAQVKKNLINILNTKKQLGHKKPYVEVQFLDWGYNHDEIPLLRSEVRMLGVDKLEVITPDWAVTNKKANRHKPRRCFWLWSVLTIDWETNYHSCTNAWTLPWPRLNFKDISSNSFWNSDLMVEARRFNVNKFSKTISTDSGCHCNSCSDMLVINRPPNYVCE
ncbi:MAG: radical protein [Ignavibacteria bacterium]|nr:radical protein [Ignavibacteria bacterium]